jgi:hypothetical protein
MQPGRKPGYLKLDRQVNVLDTLRASVGMATFCADRSGVAVRRAELHGGGCLLDCRPGMGVEEWRAPRPKEAGVMPPA